MSGEKLECPESFAVFDPAKVDLHRWLMFSDEFAVELHLLDYFFRCADQGGVTVDHFFRREGADRIYEFTIAGILA